MSDINKITPPVEPAKKDEATIKTEAKVADFFKRNKNATEVYSSNGFLFNTRGGAESHGEYVRHTRPVKSDNQD